VAHRLYDINQPAYQDVIDVFGPSILNTNNEVDRKKLGDIVFNNKVMVMTVLINNIS